MSNSSLLETLITRLNQSRVRFCHWKSNWNTTASLCESGDLDFLVDALQRKQFEEIIFAHGFETAIEPSWAATPGVRHYYGFDPECTHLLHLHIYYQLNTAGEVLKNYHLRCEELLLSNSEMHLDGIARPSRPTELVLLIVRKLLEHTSIIEFLLLHRGRRHVNAELYGLVADINSWQRDSEQYRKILAQYFPEINWSSFNAAALQFIQHGVSIRVVTHAIGIARQLKASRNNANIVAAFLRMRRFAGRIVQRLLLRRQAHSLATGGRIIALVGSDASGKSTAVQNISAWLAENLDVMCIHAGKPPATLLTYLPLKLVPLMRKLLPSSRSVNVAISKDYAPKLGRVSACLFVLRSLMVAYDRAALLRRACKARSSGRIVVSDRFPSLTAGAMDSAALDASDSKLSACPALGLFAAIERRLYCRMPVADCVIRLNVDLEAALFRNRNRIKTGSEGDEWIKFRHQQARLGKYGDARYVEIDTACGVETTLQQARAAVWRTLSPNQPAEISQVRASARA